MRVPRGGALVVPPRRGAAQREHEKAMAALAAEEALAMTQIHVALAVYETAAAYPRSRVAQSLLRRYAKAVAR